MAGKGGSYPCNPQCTCGRHTVGERRDSSAAAYKGWDDERREYQSRIQRATEASILGLLTSPFDSVPIEKGYHVAHGAVIDGYGDAKTHQCRMCDQEAYCWALNHKALYSLENIRRDPKLGFYSLNIVDYISLCGSCHRKYDNL